MIPLGLPFGSESASAKPQRVAPTRSGKANDSRASARSVKGAVIRWNASRVERLADSLTAKDRAILDTVRRLKLVTSDQLQRLHFIDGTRLSNLRRCRDSLKRLDGLGVLQRLDRRVGGVRSGSSGWVYGLGIAGKHLANDDGRPQRGATPSLTFMAHVLQASELFVRLIEGSGIGKLELLAHEPEPQCWREFTGAGGSRVRLKPDAFVRINAGDFERAYYVEIDRATESVPALGRKFKRYVEYYRTGREQARLEYFPHVLWLAPSERRKDVLVEAARRQPAEAWNLFMVRPYEEAIQAMTMGAGS
jgi:hypothetical protein